MGARKKVHQLKVKAGKVKTEIHEGKKPEESEKDVEEMEVDEVVEAVEKDKLHKIIKKKSKIRERKKGKKNGGMKFKILNMLENSTDIVEVKEGKAETTGSTVKNLVKFMKKRKNIPKDILNATFQWEIMLTGIPTKWNGNIEELTNEYKRFNLQASALRRENWDQQYCKVLHLYFKTEEDMKKAVFSGPKRDILGIPLSLRVNPIRMLYVSSVPFDISEETAYSELKEALGSGVYDITFPKNKEGKLLGHSVAYVLDEATHKELLGGKTLNLWGEKQFCCSKEDFFKRFVLNVVAGWLGDVEVLNVLVQTLEDMDIKVSVDLKTKKLYFLDESSVKKVLKKSGLLVNGRQMIFSRYHSVRFVMKCITRHTKKSELLVLLHGIKAFNLHYNETRCKATFEVPVEEVEKCKALNFKEFAGRKLEVYECGSEEMKSSRERSRKRFQEYVVENGIKFRKGHRLRAMAKFYRQMKGSKVGKRNSNSKGKKKERKNIIK